MAIFPALIIALIIVPLLEIAVLVEVGGLIGVWPTLAVVIATALAGSWLLRSQGLGVLNRARATLARNEFPAGELFDGLCLLVAGVLLLTPGFITDALGLLLFVPALRISLGRRLWRYLLARGSVDVHLYGAQHKEQAKTERDDRIIEGEFKEVPGESDADQEGDGEDRGNRPTR